MFVNNYHLVQKYPPLSLVQFRLPRLLSPCANAHIAELSAKLIKIIEYIYFLID